MKSFNPQEYLRPGTLQGLMEILADDQESLLLGGGTFIHGLAARGLMENVNRIVDLGGMNWSTIDRGEVSWEMGASVTFRELLNGGIGEVPGLGAVSDSLDYPPPQVVNLATMGGCLASASPMFDVPVAVQAVGGTVRTHGSEGTRELSMDDFFVGHFENSLGPGEVVTDVHLPVREGPTTSALIKCDTTANDLAILNVATAVTIGDDGDCESVRAILGGGGPKPQSLTNAERALVNRSLEEETIEDAVEAIELESLTLREDLRASSGYRRRMTRTLLRRTFMRTKERLENV